MAGQRADARKRTEALFSEPQWQSEEPICCERHERVLRATRRVWGDADLMDAAALADALEDEGLLA